jgi:alpha-tubulin suppressor-like RCC1 family protein
VAVASGEERSLALKSDGSVWAWGDNASGQIETGREVIDGLLAATRDETVVLITHDLAAADPDEQATSDRRQEQPSDQSQPRIEPLRSKRAMIADAEMAMPSATTPSVCVAVTVRPMISAWRSEPL